MQPCMLSRHMPGCVCHHHCSSGLPGIWHAESCRPHPCVRHASSCMSLVFEDKPHAAGLPCVVLQPCGLAGLVHHLQQHVHHHSVHRLMLHRITAAHHSHRVCPGCIAAELFEHSGWAAQAGLWAFLTIAGPAQRKPVPGAVLQLPGPGLPPGCRWLPAVRRPPLPHAPQVCTPAWPVHHAGLQMPPLVC